MTRLILEPEDTWFFRDGRPYHREGQQVDVKSGFPPAPTTVVGATRAACARALGWQGGRWGTDITEKLGDGDDLGPLRFGGPWIAREREGGWERLFPVPQSLLRGSDTDHFVALRPGEQPRRCDIGNGVRLPEPVRKVDGAKPASGWITPSGMAEVLRGNTPETGDILSEADLFSHEPRTGHERSRERGTVTEDNALYSPHHVRLQPHVALVAGVEGAPEVKPASPIPFGGEGRMAHITMDTERLEAPEAWLSTTSGPIRYAAILTTPMDITESGTPWPDQPFAGLPGRVVSACLGRVTRIGGWDGVRGRPLPLRPHLPAGSVIFMEAAGGVERVQAVHNSCIGARPQWGFGHIFIGIW